MGGMDTRMPVFNSEAACQYLITAFLHSKEADYPPKDVSEHSKDISEH
jgi:hypothetical protein